MATATNYYSVRDKNGRFTSKSGKTASKAKKKVSKKVDSVGKEIYDLFILDKSSSMSSIKEATINGFNEVLKGIQQVYNDVKVPSYCSLVEFSSNGTIKDVYWNRSCEEAEGLNNENYIPSGMTALYDAIGHGLTSLRELLGTKAKDSNVSVTVSICTDGEENDSRTWGSGKVKALIADLRDNYNWTINYIGAGEERAVKQVAKSLGIFESNTLNYKADSKGATGMFASYSNSREEKTRGFAKTGENTNFGFFSKD